MLASPVPLESLAFSLVVRTPSGSARLPLTRGGGRGEGAQTKLPVGWRASETL